MNDIHQNNKNSRKRKKSQYKWFALLLTLFLGLFGNPSVQADPSQSPESTEPRQEVSPQETEVSRDESLDQEAAEESQSSEEGQLEEGTPPADEVVEGQETNDQAPQQEIQPSAVDFTSTYEDSGTITDGDTISRNQVFQLKTEVKIADETSVEAGDTLTIDLQEPFVNTVVVEGREILNDHGDLIGTLSIPAHSNRATITFTDLFSRLPESKELSFTLRVQLDQETVRLKDSITLPINGQVSILHFEEEGTRQLISKTPTHVYDVPEGELVGTPLTWTARINADRQPVTGIVYQDRLGPGQELLADSFVVLRNRQVADPETYQLEIDKESFVFRPMDGDDYWQVTYQSKIVDPTLLGQSNEGDRYEAANSYSLHGDGIPEETGHQTLEVYSNLPKWEYYYKSAMGQNPETGRINWQLGINDKAFTIPEEAYVVDDIQEGHSLIADSISIRIVDHKTGGQEEIIGLAEALERNIIQDLTDKSFRVNLESNTSYYLDYETRLDPGFTGDTVRNKASLQGFLEHEVTVSTKVSTVTARGSSFKSDQLQVQVQKTYLNSETQEAQALNGENFTYSIVETDADKQHIEQGLQLSHLPMDEEVTISFKNRADGTYYFLVKEDKPEESPKEIVYDDTEYLIEVELTTSQSEQSINLVTEPEVKSEEVNGVPRIILTFKNIFNPDQPEEPTPEVPEEPTPEVPEEPTPEVPEEPTPEVAEEPTPEVPEEPTPEVPEEPTPEVPEEPTPEVPEEPTPEVPEEPTTEVPEDTPGKPKKLPQTGLTSSLLVLTTSLSALALGFHNHKRRR